MPDHARLDLDSFLPYRLSVLSNRLSSAIAREYSQRFDLGVTEWRVMAILGRTPDLSANQVAQRAAGIAPHEEPERFEEDGAE